MKRVCLVLLAVMTLMASFAAAEEAVTVKAAETFDIILELPELYELNEERINGILYATIASDTKETVYILTVAPSEEYAQRSISDMSKEEVEDLILAASEYFDTPVLDMTEIYRRHGVDRGKRRKCRIRKLRLCDDRIPWLLHPVVRGKSGDGGAVRRAATGGCGSA